MTSTTTVDIAGKQYVLRHMSKYLYSRMAASIADAGENTFEGLVRSAYKLLPFVLDSLQGMPPPRMCEVDGIPMLRVDPLWVAENIDTETSIKLLNASREASEVSEAEAKN